MFLDQAGWDTALAQHNVTMFMPFAPPEGSATEDAGGRKSRDFAEARNRQDVNLFDAVREHLQVLTANRKRIVITAHSAGSADRLQTVLADHGIEPIELARDWADVQRLPLNAAALAVLPMEHGFSAPDFAVITEQDILGDRIGRPRQKRKRSDKFVLEASSLAQGDLIVHIDHGIGRYDGLETIQVSGRAACLPAHHL